MPWTPPTPPDWVERLNAHGAAVGGAGYLVSLEPEDLLDAARRSTGLADFGGDTWRPHFDVLVDALRTEADLTLAGRIVARTELAAGAAPAPAPGRAWDADPSILDEEIAEPVFVVGTGRSGTSILHELLSLDPTTGPRPPGSCSTPARRSRDADTARGSATRSTPSGPTSSPPTSRCTTTTATSPTSASSPRCSSSSPTSGAAPSRSPPTPAHLVGTDQTEAYRYHRKVLQTLAAPERGRALGPQGPEPPEPAPHAVRGLPRRPGGPDPSRPAQERAVHHQPDGHAPVHALRATWTSTPWCPGSRWATP